MKITIDGNWKKGIALDFHSISSTYLGVDEQGHDQYETVRSDIGELIYQLKYQQNTAVVSAIIRYINRKVKGLSSFDYIIPTPPSKIRKIQPG